MSLIKITDASIEPVTLAEAKVHLRLTHDEEDLLVSSFISAARTDCENRLQRTLITSTWRLSLPRFEFAIMLPMGDVQSIKAVTYKDQAGATQTLSPSAYQLGRLNGLPLLMPAPGQSWPATQAGAIEAVDIEYLAGYGDTADKVPKPLKAWILLAIGDLFENRAATNIGSSVNRLPFADGLLDTYRNLTL